MTTSPILKEALIKEKKWLNNKVLQVTFTPMAPFEFEAGQFISLNVGEKAFRSYSICSNPQNSDEFSIVASVAHDGIGSNFLKNNNPGFPVKLLGPSGRFKFESSVTNQIYFISTGTGIAPFISMLFKIKNENINTKVRLMHGIRYEKDLILYDFLQKFSEELHDFKYEFCLSQEETAKHKYGRVTSNLNIEIAQNTHVYLCGNPNMVEDMKTILNSNGLPESNVFFEKFKTAVPKK